jgi:hypothetical protein
MRSPSAHSVRRNLATLPVVLSIAFVAFTTSAADLSERFAAPPAEGRILPIVHMLPETAEQQDELLRSRREKGFGGIVTNVSFADYLKSEEHWQDLVDTVHTAKDLGLALWLYDEHGYPSCKAGGLTLVDHPEWQAEGLYINDATRIYLRTRWDDAFPRPDEAHCPQTH